MDDSQTLRSMVRDDAYRVTRVLADGPSGRTELVTLDGEGPLVRKRIPDGIANASAWAAAMELDEPLLPRIESLYRMPDELVVVYEYVEGESLQKVVDRQGALAPERAVEIIQDVCRAVAALHRRGVVHRDITPGNVILATDGAHLVDLGIARQQNAQASRDTTTLGTWGFAAPEQFGFAQTDARSDVYALGRLLGYLLTGEKPDSEAYETALADESVVNAELAQVVRKATAFEPSARHQSAGELASDASVALGSSRARLWNQSAAPVSGDDGRVSTGAGATAGPGETGTSSAGSRTNSASEQRREAGRTQTFPSVTPAQQLILFAVWLPEVVFALLVAWTGIEALVRREPPYEAAQYAICVIVFASCFALAWELYRLVLRLGPYAPPERRFRLFLTRILTGFLVVLVLMFAAALVLPG